jgi:CDGSH-type Zn-finger protein
MRMTDSTGHPGQAPAEGQAIPAGRGRLAEVIATRGGLALCRCGQSQNKPYCSGMHWYVGFSDPQLSAEPTLFEWSGGLLALTRMTRLLYEKHVPADPELAAAFADMPPGHPEGEAARMAEIFGGSASRTQDDGRPAGGARDGDDPASNSQSSPRFTPRLTEEQRARWVALAAQAATEAGLPVDPAFRAALVSYLEWDSREAIAEADAHPGQQPPSRPVPRWDWTAAGPPDVAAASAADGQDSQPADVPLPAPGEPVSFDAHIKPLFREKDRQSMSFAFDLWWVDDVRTHTAAILERLRNGSMPCDSAWPEDRIAVFQPWTESGQPK